MNIAERLPIRFVARVREALDRICSMPEAHATVDQDIRRTRMPRSAANICDRVLADWVGVRAFVDGRRDTAAWQSRV